MNVTPQRRLSAGFTLVELLIVIGIIGILISLLLPAVSKVRQQVQTTNTRQMMARMETAIQAYFHDFQAYPGPFANGQLRPFMSTPPATFTLAVFDPPGQTTTTATVTASGAVPTSTENLFLGIAGGIVVDASVPSMGYSEDRARNFPGPANLNIAALKRYQRYIELQVSETSQGLRPAAADAASPVWYNGEWNFHGNWTHSTSPTAFCGDSAIPEILDKYSKPMPILYMRATRGAVPPVAATSFLPPAGQDGVYDGNYQYDIEQVTKTYSNDRPFKAPDGAIVQSMQKVWPVAASAEFTAFERTYPDKGVLEKGYESYFGNEALSNGKKVPAKKDEFILISAGPDGRYGTKDDITNFR